MDRTRQALLILGLSLIWTLAAILVNPIPPKSVRVTLTNALAQQGTVWVDARPAAEYSRGHIPHAVNLPYGRALSDPTLLTRALLNRPLIVYCDGPSCGASTRLAELMVRAGARQVQVFEDGLPAWLQSGRPLREGTTP